jgi:hypothetical protein
MSICAELRIDEYLCRIMQWKWKLNNSFSSLKEDSSMNETPFSKARKNQI